MRRSHLCPANLLWGTVLVLAAGVLAGCSGRTNDTTARSLADAAGVKGQAAAQAAPIPMDVPRQVVSTADLGVEVGDIAAATGRAGQLAVEAGGFVSSSDERRTAGDRSGRVTLKVPGDRFDRLVTAVADLGDLRSKQVTTDDVTDQVVDLDARLRAQQASADRLQQLIARAATVTEVVGVEAELAKRTSEVEALEGKIRVLRDRVDLATLSVAFSSPAAESSHAGLPGFLSGLRGGWRAMRVTAVVGSAVLGALLPWLALLGTLGLALTVWLRRRRRPIGSPAVAPTSSASEPDT